MTLLRTKFTVILSFDKVLLITHMNYYETAKFIKMSMTFDQIMGFAKTEKLRLSKQPKQHCERHSSKPAS